jgi:hypothetical protein
MYQADFTSAEVCYIALCKLFSKAQYYGITFALTVSNKPLPLQMETFKIHFLICRSSTNFFKHENMLLQRKSKAFKVCKAAGDSLL